MACAVDSSSPIRFNALLNFNGNMTSAIFTAPANSLIVACITHDGDQATNSLTVDDTGGLSWTKRVERAWTETTTGGQSAIWTAPQTTSASRQVRVTKGPAGNDSQRTSCKVYVITGADLAGTPVDTVGANNEGGSTTNNINTTSVTPASNGLLIGADCDWTAGGGAAFEAPSDGSTQDTAWYSGAISVCDGYKVCTSGVGVTMNFNAGGAAAAQHKWCQIVVLEAPAAAAKRFLMTRG